jgi:hypothetical protein
VLLLAGTNSDANAAASLCAFTAAAAVFGDAAFGVAAAAASPYVFQATQRSRSASLLCHTMPWAEWSPPPGCILPITHTAAHLSHCCPSLSPLPPSLTLLPISHAAAHLSHRCPHHSRCCPSLTLLPISHTAAPTTHAAAHHSQLLPISHSAAPLSQLLPISHIVVLAVLRLPFPSPFSF